MRGYDGAKKVNGRKRHLLVDTNGLVMKVKVHSAELADREGARVLLERVGESFPGLGHLLWADAGYRGAELRRWITEQLGLSFEIVQRKPRWVWVPNDVEPDPIPTCGLRSSDPQTLGCGAHILRVDLSQPPDESRLRVFGPDHRSIDLCDDDPTDAQKASEGNRVRTSQTPSRAICE